MSERKRIWGATLFGLAMVLAVVGVFSVGAPLVAVLAFVGATLAALGGVALMLGARDSAKRS